MKFCFCCYCTASAIDATSKIEFAKIKKRIADIYRAIAPKSFAGVNFELLIKISACKCSCCRILPISKKTTG